MSLSAPMVSQRPLGIIRAGSVGVANQVVTSGTNFLLGLFMLRMLAFEEFGRYGTLFSLCLIASGVIIAFFLEQMTVLFPDHEPGAERFLGAVLTLLLLLGAGLISAASLLLLVPSLSPLAAALAFTTALCLKEFCVRSAYAMRREVLALRLNLVMAGALAALLLTMQVADIPLSAAAILFLYSLSCALAAHWGRSALGIAPVWDVALLRSTLSALLAGGKWGVLAESLYLLRQQAHIVLTALLIGPSGVALINAARLCVTPVMVVTPAISQVFMARLVRLRAHPDELRRRGLRFSLVMTGLASVYGLLLAFAAAPLAAVLGAELLPDIAPLVAAWLCVAMTSAIISGLEASQKALRRFQALLLIGVPAALLSLVSCWFLLGLYGPLGAVFSLVFTQIFFLFCLGRLSLFD